MELISDDQLDTLGRLAHRLDNALEASKLPLPAQMHVEQLQLVLFDVSKDINQLVELISGTTTEGVRDDHT